LGVAGAVLGLGTGLYSARTLCTLISVERLPRAAQRLFALLRLTPVAEGSKPSQNEYARP
jgi:hypothetical protein